MRPRALWSVANDLRPFYDDQAKARQVQSGGDVRGKTVLEKIPEQKDAPTARDEAGKVAGVNAKYVDMARDVSLVDANQLGRRNLTGDQASILRGRRYNRTKQSHGGQLPKGRGQNDPSLLPKTAETLGKQHGVSSSTIKRDGKRAQALEKLAETRPEVLVLWRDAMKGQGKRNDLCSNPTEVKTERGRSYTVSRLQRESPALFAQVVAKTLSANAAAIQAGTTPPYFPYGFPTL